MIKNSCLDELPKERIFGEIQKLLLKASKISLGFKLLKELGAFEYFTQLKSLNDKEWNKTLMALDEILKYRSSDAKRDTVLALSVLSFGLKSEVACSFLLKISDEKELLKRVLSLIKAKLSVIPSNYELYSLAQDVNLNELIMLRVALEPKKVKIYQEVKKRVKELGVQNKALKPLIQGRDLLELGLKASPAFKSILEESYEAQKNETFANHEDAILWLKKRLLG